MQQLTDRQAQIMRLLDQGISVREIGNLLGISRNAVYQQIEAIKRKGHLDTDFTASGEVRIRPGATIPDQSDIIRDLVRQQGELMAIIKELATAKG